MEFNYLVSIIVPAYNAEKTIKRCIDSLLEQTYKDIEIIIIDDGSQDSTEEKCKEYREKNQIRYIKIENTGVSGARNWGIDNATGSYIVFVDSDDYIEKTMIEKLVNNAKNADLVICTKKTITKKGIIEEKLNSEESSFTKKDFVYLYKSKLINPPYCKLYRSEIINRYNVRFDKQISIGEDLLFNINYLKNITQNIVILNENLYNYEKVNESSLSEKYQKNMFEMKFMIANELKNSIELIGEHYNEIQLIVFDLLLSAVTNEFRNRKKNLISRYICSYKIIKNTEIVQQIEILKKNNLITKLEYRILNSFFFILYIIFRKRKKR